MKIIYFHLYIDRDAQHNISYSEISNAVGGAIYYTTAGEVSPILTMEGNRIMSNCRQLYGNFSTCDAAVKADVQNMQTIHFRVRFRSASDDFIDILYINSKLYFLYLYRTIWCGTIKVVYIYGQIHVVQLHHYAVGFITIYFQIIKIVHLYMLRVDNLHRIKMLQFTKIILHKIWQPMLMLLSYDKLYQILRIIMCIAIEVVELLKYLDLKKFVCQFIRQRHIMDFMSKIQL